MVKKNPKTLQMAVIAMGSSNGAVDQEAGYGQGSVPTPCPPLDSPSLALKLA